MHPGPLEQDPCRSKPWLVVVSGHPGAGKTTFARRLGAETGAPVFTKDALKEALFDALLVAGGTVDRAFSCAAGRACSLLLGEAARASLSAGRDAIVESNFWPEFAGGELSALAASTGARILEVNVRATADVLERRFVRRQASGKRHPGHGDGDLAMWEGLRTVIEGDPHLVVGVGELIVLENGAVEDDDAAFRATLEDVKHRLS